MKIFKTKKPKMTKRGGQAIGNKIRSQFAPIYISDDFLSSRSIRSSQAKGRKWPHFGFHNKKKNFDHRKI